MKSKTKRQIKSLAKALKLDKVFWHYYRMFQNQELPSGVFGHFADSRGNSIPLIEGLRDHLKPGWQAMFDPPVTKPSLPSQDFIINRFKYWQGQVRKLEQFLNTLSLSFIGKDVLEIGTYTGATAYALADAGANHALGIDIAAYYIHQTPGGVVSAEAVELQNEKLNRERDNYRRLLEEKIGNRVSFREDDICSSTLSSASIDVIFSWEVLEHLTSPIQAFQEMFRLLKPGGIAFHEYNPFFSLDGGHSLCTLDFLWGHARLTASDFEKYLREVRPEETEVALSFYHNNLNRMTLADLQHYVSEVGFTTLAIMPWPQRSHIDHVTSNILKECMDIYPSLELMDLISPYVWVILQKK